MFKSVESLLERLAHRCLAIVANMLASKLESLHLNLWAERQRQLEESARSLEAEGAGELATMVRDKIKTQLSDDPGAQAETWLQPVTDVRPVLGVYVDSNAAKSTLRRPATTENGERSEGRPAGRSKRQRPINDQLSPESPPPVASELFFPLHPNATPSAVEETPQ